jgi:hypothetical protein
MKCIKVVKETKDNKIGTIRRVTDSEADTKVSSGVWAFAPKSEWKQLNSKSVKREVLVEDNTEPVERVKSKKQLKKDK